MTTAIYLEHYLESLESLPVELQRNFTLMRDLDGRAQGIMREIDSISDEFLRNASGISRDKKKELDQKLQRLFSKAKEYADDKVQLAIQTYELVDKHIRRLDSDLARFESEIKNGTVNIGPAGSVATLMSPRLATANALAAAEVIETGAKATTKKGRKREREPTTKKTKATTSKNEPEEKVPKTGKSAAAQAPAKGGKSPGVARKKQKTEIQLVAEQVAAATGSSGEVLDMPVDPNEPTYCICHQVSYGQMIACDNPDCTIEWFHIVCMGLSSIPKGKWYCPKCQPLRKK